MIILISVVLSSFILQAGNWTFLLKWKSVHDFDTQTHVHTTFTASLCQPATVLDKVVKNLLE